MHSILFDIDSPGGIAVGPYELAESIYKARSRKPIYSYIGRNGSSAAYWLASATEKIIVNPSALVGSIGVVTTIPVQEQPNSEGYKNVEIVSSNAANKRPDPRTEEGLSEIKSELDDLENTFISSIAKYRNLTTGVIKNDFGKGGVVIGSKAVNRNMADLLGSYEEALAILANHQSLTNNLTNNQIMTKAESKTESVSSKMEITADYIKKEFPNVASSIIDEAALDIKKQAFNEGVEAGTKAERERILAIESASLPGHEDLIAKAKSDPNMSAEKIALQIIASEKSKGSEYLANAKEAEKEMPKVEASVQKTSSDKVEVSDDAPLEDRAKANWHNDAKIRAEFGNDFDSYLAFAKASEDGQVRILSSKKQ